jgi:hypothetical protein
MNRRVIARSPTGDEAIQGSSFARNDDKKRRPDMKAGAITQIR